MISRFVSLRLPSTGSSSIMIFRFVSLCLPSTGSCFVMISRFVSLCLPSTGCCLVIFPGLSPLVPLLLDPVPSWFPDLSSSPFVPLCLPSTGSCFVVISRFVSLCLPLSPFYWFQFPHDFQVCHPLSPFCWILLRRDFQVCLPLSPFYWILFPHISRFVSLCLSLSPFYWILFRRIFRFVPLRLPSTGSSFFMISRFVSLCLLFYWILFRRDFQVCHPLSPFYSILFRHMISRFVSLCLPSTGFSSVMISRFVSLCLPSTGSCFVVFLGLSPFVCLLLVSVPSWFPGLFPFASLLLDPVSSWFPGLSPFVSLLLDPTVVVPLRKPGKAKDSIASHRPVSLMPLGLKLLDRLLFQRLWPHVNVRKQLIPWQQGGIGGADASFAYVGDVLRLRSLGLLPAETVIAFVDGQSAFCRPPALTVASRLRMTPGVHPVDVLVTKNLLQSLRSRAAIFGGLHRLWKNETGLPQGGTLSVALFTLLTVPLYEELVAAEVGLPSNLGFGPAVCYVDDVALLLKDHGSAQEALNTTAAWASSLRMKLNVGNDKSAVLLGRNNTPPPALYLDDELLPTVSSYRYLGGILHCSGIVRPMLLDLESKMVKKTGLFVGRNGLAIFQ